MARSAGIDRALVVATAAELADANGLEALTLAQVAGRLGIRLPSLYNHVDGMPGLRRELALLGLRELVERIGQAAIGKAGDAAVLAIAEAYRAYAGAHPGRYAAGLRAPAADDREWAQITEHGVDILLAVLAPYGLSKADALHAVRGLRSILHGFATLESAGSFGMPFDRDESFRRLVRAYIAGLSAR